MMNRLRPGTGRVETVSDIESLTGRKKITLAPGHSLMDWIRLGRTKGDLSGVGNEKRPVTLAELAVHNTTRDMWMAIRGKVYNITPYMDYHPGGVDELMRAAGKEGTQLFDEIHNWVNVESMLEKCLIGPLVLKDTKNAKAPERSRQTSIVSETRPKSALHPSPKFTWKQTGNTIGIEIRTTFEALKDDFVVVDLSVKSELLVQVLIDGFAYFIHMKLEHQVLLESTVDVTKGIVHVTLKKEIEGKHWGSLGQPLKLHEAYPRMKNFECSYRLWTCTSNTEVTHDTRLLCFQAPQGLRMIPPIGYHIHIKKSISGMEIARSYTVTVPSIFPEDDTDSAHGKFLFFMIKSYPGGAISPWITSLKVGEKVQLSNYDGTFDLSRLDQITHLVCFAAGTGFTSMIRVLKHALFGMGSATFLVKLVFYNKLIKDILWRSELDSLTGTCGHRFSVNHVLSQETEANWPGLRGRVNGQHIEMFIPKPSDKVKPLLLICGQWAYNDAVESLAKLYGLADEHIHIFSQST